MDANEKFCELVEAPHSELMNGMSFLHFTVKEDLDYSIGVARQLLNKSIHSFQFIKHYRFVLIIVYY